MQNILSTNYFKFIYVIISTVVIISAIVVIIVVVIVVTSSWLSLQIEIAILTR